MSAVKLPEAGARLRVTSVTEKPIFLIAEAVGPIGDEGYRNFALEIRRALERRLPIRCFTAGGDPASGMQKVARTPVILLGPTLLGALRQQHPNTVLYLAKSSATLAGLFRARLLKWAAGGAFTIVVALQPRRLSPPMRIVARWLWPDLLVVTSEAERLQAAWMGARAACIRTGVDLSRFRPALPGEKMALRKKWGLPIDRQVVLHVGHLKVGRNLEALYPIARIPGVTMVLLASSRREKASPIVHGELVRQGIIVLDGYRPEVAELYRLADCYLFPVQSSDWAISLPLSVIEALASDVPVVTSRFGALPECFADTGGVRFVDRADGFADSITAMLKSRPPTRHLVEGWTWDALADRLLELREDLGMRPRGKVQWWQTLALLLALSRRAFWKYEEVIRSVAWGRRLGFERRVRPSGNIVRIKPRAEALPVRRAQPVGATVGVVTGADRERRSVVSVCAGFYGLRAIEVPPADMIPLLRRAISESLPLLAIELDSGAGVREEGFGLLATFLRRGGTLFLSGIGPGNRSSIESISHGIGVTLPPGRANPSGAALRLSDRPDFAAELAGTRIEPCLVDSYLEAPSQARVLAWVEALGSSYPAVVEQAVNGGRVVCSAGSSRLVGPLYEGYSPSQALGILPAMMLLRQLYASAAWQPPLRLANFTVDDPVLRNGVMGIPWQQALGQAVDANFHLTVATVPRELGLATPDVVQLLAQNPNRMSACYHGNNHDGYEFYLTSARRHRFRRRPYAEQRAALAQALTRGRRFSERTGYTLDPVMVFPHGIGPIELLPALQSLGFLASCNTFDRFPLGTTTAPTEDIGMRPADLAWGGFPLLWRRNLGDRTFPLDLFLGRPVIAYAHRETLGPDMLPLAARASEVNQLGGGSLTWASLAEIARHAYLQREDSRLGWQVWMMANEICLHNPSPEARQFRVRRPDRPPHFQLVAQDDRVDADEIDIVVPGNGAATVGLVENGLRPAHRRECSLLRAEAFR